MQDDTTWVRKSLVQQLVAPLDSITGSHDLISISSVHAEPVLIWHLGIVAVKPPSDLKVFALAVSPLKTTDVNRMIHDIRSHTAIGRPLSANHRDKTTTGHKHFMLTRNPLCCLAFMTNERAKTSKDTQHI
jgi:hypothetical protein